MSTYTVQPKLPEDIAALYETILQTLDGKLTVVEAAEKLGLSRVQTHSLLNRAAAGILESLLPKKPGRKSMPERERRLQEEVERLRKENARLQDRVETIDRLMGVASGILRGQVRTRTPKTPKKKKEEGGGNEPEEPDGETRRRLEQSRRLRALGMNAVIAAGLVGVCASTLGRWERRIAAGLPARNRCGPKHRPALSAEKALALGRLVREMHGLSGAQALARAVGVSRRQAAAVKERVLTEIERERIARCTRVEIDQPGVMRNLDQLYLEGRRLALIASDAKVPFRTSAATISAYTGQEVARVLSGDFAEHGAPLVLRMDLASAHDTREVAEVLRAHQVLLLHGPPRYPQYYGQHERQNREHRAWLALSTTDDEELQAMVHALNEKWPRKSLGWDSAAARWRARQPLLVGRVELRADVDHRAARLQQRLRGGPHMARLARRLAIEQALEDRGLIRRIARGWC